MCSLWCLTSWLRSAWSVPFSPSPRPCLQQWVRGIRASSPAPSSSSSPVGSGTVPGGCPAAPLWISVAVPKGPRGCFDYCPSSWVRQACFVLHLGSAGKDLAAGILDLDCSFLEVRAPQAVCEQGPRVVLLDLGTWVRKPLSPLITTTAGCLRLPHEFQ